MATPTQRMQLRDVHAQPPLVVRARERTCDRGRGHYRGWGRECCRGRGKGLGRGHVIEGTCDRGGEIIGGGEGNVVGGGG